ncbi:putative aminoadipate reductase, partial [Mycena belliarum]
SMFIPEAIAYQSRTNPAHPFYVYAKPDPSDEIVTITSLEFARATHRAAHLLRPNRNGADGEVVAIIALSDTTLYEALIVGLITANLIPFPISPRNTPAAVVNLVQKSGCHRVLATCTTLQPLVAGIRNELAQVAPDFELLIQEVPSLLEIYPTLGAEDSDAASELYPAHPAPLSPEDICIYLHTSGSTGLPKPIAHSHRTLMHWASSGVVEEVRDAYPHPVAAMPIPGFHLIGIYGLLLKPIYGGITIALYPPTALTPGALPVFPSPDNILANTRKTKSRVMFTLPALLAIWAKSPDAIEFLKTLSFIATQLIQAFGGGCLPQRLGNALAAAGLKIQAVYGATEFGSITSMLPYKEDVNEWEWFRFSSKVKLRWMPQGDGTYECQVLHTEDYNLSVANLPDIRGYATSDLFVNHPQKKHLWKIVGRADDVIVHQSGENTVPAPMEDVINSSPLVAAAVMFGRDHNQAGILIEVEPSSQIDVTDSAQVLALREKLWPIIEEANSVAPKYSRIFPEMVLFTSPTKPLPRSGKGTVMRKAALLVFAAKIEALYETMESSGGSASVAVPTAWDASSIQRWLLELTADLVQGGTRISPDVDLFEQGFDSLSAAFLRLRVVSAMQSSKDPAVRNAASGVTQNTVYLFRSVSGMTVFLGGLVSGVACAVMRPKVAMDEMISKYTSALPPLPSLSNATSSLPLATVLLTGSTGSLGSQILATLVEDERVAKIYAFNRPSKATTLVQRQEAIFNDRGLDIALLESPKLVLIEGEINRDNLGLSADIYSRMLSSITLIIHNAWTLDFNLPLASFKQHVSGTRNLIHFARSCDAPPRFIFTSSVTSGFLDIGDTASTDASLVASAATGYGQSKYVAEQILAKSGLDVVCLRIGQISGALPKGAWAISDWLPILVKTSVTLGRLPKANGVRDILLPVGLKVVSWIDFRTVARAVLDVAFSCATRRPQCSILALVHPRPVAWNFVMTAVRECLISSSEKRPLPLVEFREWLAELESAATQRGGKSEHESLPGIKLLEFFSKLSVLSCGSLEAEFAGIDLVTEEIQAASPAVREAKAIDTEQVDAWVAYWRSTGFL